MKQTTEEMIAIMEHYADGGIVEYSLDNEEWYSDEEPEWDWLGCFYRRKEEKEDHFNREIVKKRGEVMLHYGKGGDVEYLDPTTLHWLDAKLPTWDWSLREYRIKEKSFSITLLYDNEEGFETDFELLCNKDYQGVDGNYGYVLNLHHIGVEK